MLQRAALASHLMWVLRVLLVVVFCAHALHPVVLSAQVVSRDTLRSVRVPSPVFIGWLDVGGASMEQPSSESMGVATFGGGLARIGARTSAMLDVVSAHSGSVGSAQQLNGLLSASPFLSRAMETELAAFTTLFNRANQDARNTGFQLRQRFDGMLGGVPVGGHVAAGRGNTRRTGLFSVGAPFDTMTFFGTEVGASLWVTPSAFTIGARWSRLRGDDFPLAEASGFFLTRHASAYDQDEIALQASARLARARMQATVVRRNGRAATQGEVTGGVLSLTAALTRASEITVAAGRALADPMRGVPQANFVTAGIRVAFDLGRPATRNVVREATIETFPTGGGILYVRVNGSATDIVEIAGSHNEWEPVRLSREGSVFVARVVLPTGTHRVVVRVNGSEWRAPHGLARVTDDMGGEAGVVVIP